MSDTIEYKDHGLKNLIAALKNKIPVAKVGVLAGKNNRKDDGTNASIGYKHEFGKDGMPQRSFLRVPLVDNLQKFLNKSNAFTEEVLLKVIDEKSLTEWVIKMGHVGENVVAEAFHSTGFGKWKKSNMSFKKVKQTLVETQQLRNSISSEVK